MLPATGSCTGTGGGDRCFVTTTICGVTQQAARWVAIVPGTGCHIVGTDDDGGDRKAAILCRPGTRGEVWVWLMDGTTKLSETWAATVPDVGCQVVKVN